ncbi:L-arabinokinase [Arachis hypogaea]|nr:L-arabinokinase [Arachis hypogaea]
MVAIKMGIKMGMKQQEEYDGDGAAAVYSTPKMVFAYYVTGHEFGHATRVAKVVRHLILAGHDVHVVTAAPEFVFTNEVHSPCLFFRKISWTVSRYVCYGMKCMLGS